MIYVTEFIGRLMRIAKAYNPNYQSRGILFAIQGKEDTWLNVTGTEEECNKIIANFKMGDVLKVTTKDQTKIITKLEPYGFKPASLPETPKSDAEKIDQNLYSVVAMMNRAFLEAKNTLKAHIREDLMEQSTLSMVAIEIFKAWRKDDER